MNAIHQFIIDIGSEGVIPSLCFALSAKTHDEVFIIINEYATVLLQ